VATDPMHGRRAITLLRQRSLPTHATQRRAEHSTARRLRRCRKSPYIEPRTRRPRNKAAERYFKAAKRSPQQLVRSFAPPPAPVFGYSTVGCSMTQAMNVAAASGPAAGPRVNQVQDRDVAEQAIDDHDVSTAG